MSSSQEVPTGPRVKRYPLIAYVYVGVYIGGEYDVNSRTKHAQKELTAVAKNTLGIHVPVERLRMYVDNAAGETWSVAAFTLLFDNITRAELESYADRLSKVISAKNKEDRIPLIKYEKGETEPPLPFVEVPTPAWLRAELAGINEETAKAEDRQTQQKVEATQLATEAEESDLPVRTLDEDDDLF